MTQRSRKITKKDIEIFNRKRELILKQLDALSQRSKMLVQKTKDLISNFSKRMEEDEKISEGR